jgi:hypothetical protein
MKPRVVIPEIIHIPNLSCVPDYSDVEADCRYAGEIPKSDPANRAHTHIVLLRLVKRKYACEGAYDDVAAVNADVAALTLYFNGAFDRKRSDGRPFDEVAQQRYDDAVEQVQAIRRLERCTRDEAIRRLLARRGYGERSDLFAYIRNAMNR